jgi:hypothetical protein
MTTPRRLLANRENARASTGPRSVTGKVRASLNAHRHGLSVPICTDPVLAAEAEALIRNLAGAASSPQLLAQARHVAEAQTEVDRVRRRQRDLMKLFHDQGDDEANRTKAVELSKAQSAGDVDDSESMAVILATLVLELHALERYERRALSRRNRAMDAFDTVRVLDTCAANATAYLQARPD